MVKNNINTYCFWIYSIYLFILNIKLISDFDLRSTDRFFFKDAENIFSQLFFFILATRSHTTTQYLATDGYFIWEISAVCVFVWALLNALKWAELSWKRACHVFAPSWCRNTRISLMTVVGLFEVLSVALFINNRSSCLILISFIWLWLISHEYLM